jgi:hypothetical protein
MKYLPEGSKMKDPSKLQSSRADALLEFWLERQKAKIQPTFEFQAWQDHEKEMREPVDSREDLGDNFEAEINQPVAKKQALVRKAKCKVNRKVTQK